MVPLAAAQILCWWLATCPAWRLCQLLPELCSQKSRKTHTPWPRESLRVPRTFWSACSYLWLPPPPTPPQWVLMSGHLQERASGPSSLETRVLSTGESLQTSLEMTAESRAGCCLAWSHLFYLALQGRHAKRGGGKVPGLINTGDPKAVLSSDASRDSGPVLKQECPMATSVEGTISKATAVQHRRLSLNLNYAFPLSFVFFFCQSFLWWRFKTKISYDRMALIVNCLRFQKIFESEMAEGWEMML